MPEIKARIRKRIKEISDKKILYKKQLFIFGHNIYTDYINNLLHEEGYILSGIIDNNKEKQGKKICNTIIFSPEEISWGQNTLVLIASKHEESMREQIKNISDEVEIYSLYDFSEMERMNEFWKKENYEKEIEVINQGALIYEKLKQKERLIIFPPPALGDIFIGCLSLQDYAKKIKSKNLKIVVSSKGAYKVTQLFEINNVVIISEREMDALVKFTDFYGESGEDIICSWGGAFWLMSMYQKVPFAQYCAKYFYGLERYSMRFPSIWDEDIKDELASLGLVEGKTIILAPYANSVEELPIQFWEKLTEKLLKMKYCVVTNIVGMQKPVKGTMGIQIPLRQIGSYLEFAGCFIALRSGLCDVAGQSRCKQIIFFRDQQCGFHTSVLECYDMHAENISADAIQCLYDDDFERSIDRVVNYLKNES